ncbi:MAG TPA: metalloregulator ArsR/SmtB family transcription factor [Acidimicrobiales bacterium]|nr:metalloregulator ArsR/SmtB family transcription factor [Acidimicrobiales bacterium]
MANPSEPVEQRAEPGTLEVVSELLRALANPHRLAILLELGHGPRCVHELVDSIGISQPLASQHLRVLKATHLVRGRRRGREVVYTLADEHISHIVGDAIAHAGERRG